MSLLEQYDSLDQFEPMEYEFMHPPDSFQLLSFKVVVKIFDTKFGKKPYTYLDSEPRYLLSERGSEDFAKYLKENNIEAPCFAKMKETTGSGYETHYVFVTIKPPKRLKLDEPKS